MSSMKIRNIIEFILFILMLVVIWGHSMQDANTSSSESMWIVDWLSDHGIEVTEHLIRKLAHLTEYAILGYILSLNWRNVLESNVFDFMTAFRNYFRILGTMFDGLIIALIDESIQYTSEGRSAEVRDVWIDFGGICIGILFATIFIMLVAKHKKNQDE